MALTKDYHKRGHVIDGIDLYLIEASYRWWLPNPWFFRIWMESYDDIIDIPQLSYVQIESRTKMGFRECIRKVKTKYYHEKRRIHVKNRKQK